jgi:hypothetical protein
MYFITEFIVNITSSASSVIKKAKHIISMQLLVKNTMYKLNATDDTNMSFNDQE